MKKKTNIVYGTLKCPDNCNNKDILCRQCVDADCFDSNAQE